ncbi:kynureninase [Paraglaciecola hydrolytica]|uniref:Kynureninase n=1 Tax=Paraglaciecola hydrolytica TaxID=1799789 RepID=A0A136A5P8_9ALTE|nr:kynureninase [Paraglaciecola hydrolytica]KXI30541.1 kynureninase [Paraglaciecola hydrolytica]
MTFQDVQALDLNDPLADRKKQFSLPADCIYLDGNSLGALPIRAKNRTREVIEQQWGQDLIKSWNTHHWIDLPAQTGEKIASLIGAAAGQVICCDSISVNLFKLLCSALNMQKGRTVVLSQQDNFPTDLYMVQGLAELLGQQQCELRLQGGDNIVEALTADVAVLLLTQVNFRTGYMHDMQLITQLAHQQGILVIWDLAHSAGALPIELDKCEVDFAVGCGYKYLNGGPGAPAFVYVAERHQAIAKQPLSGWMGHAKPFDFSPQYQPGQGMLRFLCGTPSIVSMSVLDAALEVFDGVDMCVVRDKSCKLAQLYIGLVAQAHLTNKLTLISPLRNEDRGSQVSYTHVHAFAICQALIARNIICDFRAPDVLRVGFTPLYTSYVDIWNAVEHLQDIVHNEIYHETKYNQLNKVT